jgi:hypothetical protein
VNFLYTGVREQSPGPGRLPGNRLHLGINPRLEKGADPPQAPAEPWFHIRQNKHHRWSLDENQINQYHLGGVLHPGIQWWEAIDVPRHAVEFIEVAELTLACLICQDLATNDDIAALMRSVGPTVVLTALLDGPQLTSRWAARYASVLADDPGSAVLTLSSFGMVARSRPHGRDAAPIVALWKDPSRGIREIPLETGADGVVLTVCMSRATRRTADGRWPVDNGTLCYNVGVHQVSAAGTGSGFLHPPTSSSVPAPQTLEPDELTVLTAWAEAAAEVLAYAPGDTAAVLGEARSGAPWRASLGLPEPSPQLSTAIEAMRNEVLTATDGAQPTFATVLSAAGEDRSDEPALDALVRRVLRAMLEERKTRETAGGTPRTPASTWGPNAHWT